VRIAPSLFVSAGSHMGGLGGLSSEKVPDGVTDKLAGLAVYDGTVPSG
jgi:hypothetical protein